MNLSAFNTMLSASLRRGTSLDTQLPQQTSMAFQWLERNYTFKYMETFALLTIPSGQRQLAIPNALIKSWKFFRIINTDGSYSYLDKIEPEDLNLVSSTANTLIANSIPSGTTNFIIQPGNYFQVGLSQVVLDAVPSQAFNSEIMFFNYSSIPIDSSTYPVASLPAGISASTFTHPLLNVASDLVLAQAQMLCAANLIKDLRMMAAYKAVRDEAINTLTRAEDEAKYGGEAMSMIYDPQWDWSQVSAQAALGINTVGGV